MPHSVEMRDTLGPMDLFRLRLVRFAATFTESRSDERIDLLIFQIARSRKERDDSVSPGCVRESITPGRAGIAGRLQVGEAIGDHLSKMRCFAEPSRDVAVCF